MKISNEYGHCCYCLCNSCSMIYNLYIKKEHRKKGHATDLVKRAIEEIRAEGYEDAIKIAADPEEDIDKESLIKFYEKMNLTVIGQ